VGNRFIVHGFFVAISRRFGIFLVMNKKALISRCLLGAACRWDGNRLKNNKLIKLDRFETIAVCPEMDGGLPCPRPAAEIVDGDGFYVLDGKSRVIDIEGRDVTDNYLRGAQKALNAALQNGAESAYLKDNSPSCGITRIVQGQLNVPGMGVTAALLRRHNIRLEPC